MNDKKFCCVGDFPVLVPYQDLEKLLTIARKQEAWEGRLSRMDEKLSAIYGIYLEVLEKLKEIDNNL